MPSKESGSARAIGDLPEGDIDAGECAMWPAAMANRTGISQGAFAESKRAYRRSTSIIEQCRHESNS